MTIISGVLMYDKSSWFNSQPKIIPDNGDGTVNVRSLRACLNWQKQQKQPIYHKEFPRGGSHDLAERCRGFTIPKTSISGQLMIVNKSYFLHYKSALVLKIV